MLNYIELQEEHDGFEESIEPLKISGAMGHLKWSRSVLINLTTSRTPFDPQIPCDAPYKSKSQEPS